MMEQKTETIAAVVVTFNRLELLKRCIQALRKQTRKVDEIIVVNNASTDGTLDWLNSQVDLTIITQENSGSAGGQYSGIKKAYESGYDWIWCMDDDGFAKENALFELLVANRIDCYVRNSLVVDIDKTDRLSFGLYDFKRKIYFLEIKDLIGDFFDGVPNFFNGSLIHKDIISKVGFPFKEFFIKGDELEYSARIIKNGFRCATVFSSIFYHKYEKNILIDNFIFSHKFLFMDSGKRYYHNKNLIIIHKLHKLFSLITFMKMFTLDLFFIFFLQRKNSIILNFGKGILDGIKFNIKKLITNID